MQIPEDHLAIFRGCLLLSVDKYRKMRDLAERLNETETRAHAENQRRTCEQIAATGEIDDDAFMALAVNAVTLSIDTNNRLIQDLVGRGAINEAGTYEHRVRECYALLGALNATTA